MEKNDRSASAVEEKPRQRSGEFIATMTLNELKTEIKRMTTPPPKRGRVRRLTDAASDAKKLFVSPRELADRWGISLAHAYRAGDTGLLPVMRVGLSVRYPIAAVEQYERNETR